MEGNLRVRIYTLLVEGHTIPKAAMLLGCSCTYVRKIASFYVERNELGKGDGLKAIMDICEKCRGVQYGRGHTDLIEKLKVEMKLAGWHQGMSIHQEQEMGDYRRGQIDVMHWLERRASESLGRNHQIAHVNGGSKTKPEKPKTTKVK